MEFAVDRRPGDPIAVRMYVNIVFLSCMDCGSAIKSARVRLRC